MRKPLLKIYVSYNECSITLRIKKTIKAIYILEKIIKNLIACGPK